MNPEGTPASKNFLENQPNIASAVRLLNDISEEMKMENTAALIELLPDINEKIEALREAQKSFPSAVNVQDAFLKLYTYREKIEAMQKS